VPDVKVDNPLSREFILGYPAEAARVLEQVSAEHVAALFTELSPQTVVPVMAAMLPESAAACLGEMAASSAARLVTELPLSSSACIYRLLAASKQEELSGYLSGKRHSRIRRYLEYPPTSAGALLGPRIDVLPDNVTVAEAIRRIERFDHPASCRVYIIDDAHRLVGMIDLGRLLTSRHHARLRDIMTRKTPSVSAHATAETLLSHPGWATRRRLPVVERDNTLVGILEYNNLRDAVGEPEVASARDPLENLLSLAGLYWLSVAQLLDSVLGTAAPDKGDQQ
jgi:magnesium transporter